MSDTVFLIKPYYTNPLNSSVFETFLKDLHKNIGNNLCKFVIEGQEGYLFFKVIVPSSFKESFKILIKSHYPNFSIEESTLVDYQNILPVCVEKTDLLPIQTTLSSDSGILLLEVLQKLAQSCDFIFELTLSVQKTFLLLKPVHALKDISIQKTLNYEQFNLAKEKSNDLLFHSFICFKTNNIKLLDKTLIDIYLKLFSSKQSNKFIYSNHPQKLSIKELNAIFHFPLSLDDNTKVIAKTKRTLVVPKEISDISKKVDSTKIGTGLTDLDKNTLIAISKEDRFKHVYVIGKTGSGKTKLIENMLKQDLEANRCAILLDPHGESVFEILNLANASNYENVVLIDFSSKDFVFTFNPLHGLGNYTEPLIDSLIEAFRKFFGIDWNPKMEFLLRQILNALKYTPNPTLLDIHKLLIDSEFKDEVIKQIQDSSVKSFWSTEYLKFSDTYHNQAVSPILSKLGQLFSNSVIRSILASSYTSFDIHNLIQQKKIILFNLSTGKLGQYASNFLGSLIISSIVHVMFFQDSKNQKQSLEAFLYVDEFQNFGSNSFIKILAEARKFKLGLTLAHQYSHQIDPEIMKAILGNVGSVISFTLGHQDANSLFSEFAPYLEAKDFVQLGKREFWARLQSSEASNKPLGGYTLPLIYSQYSYAKDINSNSVSKYAKLKLELDKLEKSNFNFVNSKQKNSFDEPIL